MAFSSGTRNNNNNRNSAHLMQMISEKEQADYDAAVAMSLRSFEAEKRKSTENVPPSAPSRCSRTTPSPPPIGQPHHHYTTYHQPSTSRHSTSTDLIDWDDPNQKAREIQIEQIRKLSLLSASGLISRQPSSLSQSRESVSSLSPSVSQYNNNNNSLSNQTSPAPIGWNVPGTGMLSPDSQQPQQQHHQQHRQQQQGPTNAYSGLPMSIYGLRSMGHPVPVLPVSHTSPDLMAQAHRTNQNNVSDGSNVSLYPQLTASSSTSDLSSIQKAKSAVVDLAYNDNRYEISGDGINQVRFRRHPDPASANTVASSAVFEVPFRPSHFFHIDGNLIDLGPTTDANPVAEFDPLYPRKALIDAARLHSTPQTQRQLFIPPKPIRRTAKSSDDQPPDSTPVLPVKDHSYENWKRFDEAIEEAAEVTSIPDKTGSCQFWDTPLQLVDRVPDMVKQMRVARRQLHTELVSDVAWMTRSVDWTCSSIISPMMPNARLACSLESIKLIVYAPITGSTDTPSCSFTCDPSCSVEIITEQAIIILKDDRKISCNVDSSTLALKVFGLDEYLLPDVALNRYSYLHECLMNDRDVKLELSKPPVADNPSMDWLLDDDEKEEHTQCAAVSGQHMQTSLDTLHSEMLKIRNRDGKSKLRAFLDVLKLICRQCNAVEPLELVVSLKLYQESVQRYRDDGDSMAEFLMLGEAGIRTSVANLVRAYARSSDADYTVLPEECMDQSVDGESSKRCSVPRSLQSGDIESWLTVEVKALYNLPPHWKRGFDEFAVSACLFHGPCDLCNPAVCSTKLIHKCQFEYIKFAEELNLRVQICALPRDARLCFTLTAMCKRPNEMLDGSVQMGHQILGRTMLPLFDHENIMCQGDLLLPVQTEHCQQLQPWGRRPLLSAVSVDPVLAVTIPETHGTRIVFPDVMSRSAADQLSSSCASKRQSRFFDSLDLETQQNLIDVIEGELLREIDADTSEVLWEKREYLCEYAAVLPKVIQAAPYWDWASVTNVLNVLHMWTPDLPCELALQMLQPQFTNWLVRQWAVDRLASSCLRPSTSSEPPGPVCANLMPLIDLLPQLVESLRYDTDELSPTALLLLRAAVLHRRIAFYLYYQLEERICQLELPRNRYAPQHRNNRWVGCRFTVVQQELMRLMVHTGFCEQMRLQRELCAKLDEAAACVKATAASAEKKMRALTTNMYQLDSSLLSQHVRLPVHVGFMAAGVHVDKCTYFNSLTSPIKIMFKTVGPEYGIIHKVGDDLRKDSLVLQLTRLMNEIWLDDGLDLKMLIFKCLPTGKNSGMIELVRNCETMHEIQGTTGMFARDRLHKWLQKHNEDPLMYHSALSNFTLSCAGWCVATYVLGIGDRHNDNLLVTTRGHMLHIDFGKFFGDFQLMIGGIKRDRVPFILTKDMVYVINRGETEHTEQFQLFVNSCCRAYNLLRRRAALIVNVLKMMSLSGIGGVTEQAAQYALAQLSLSDSEAEATERFTSLICASFNAFFPKLNFFAHALAQKQAKLFGAGASAILWEDDKDSLSFVQQNYSFKAGEAPIKSVQLLGFEKWHMPEKVYVYKIQVDRRTVHVPDIVYRSHKEFVELSWKLYRKYPLAGLRTVSTNGGLIRSNVREVAERRRPEIDAFVRSLNNNEHIITESDLVATFFHPIHRDQALEQQNYREPTSQGTPSTSTTGEPTSLIGGDLQVELSYDTRKAQLQVLVQHARNLHRLPSGSAPDTYVKCYLRPGADPRRLTKRKTRVIVRAQHPTYNDVLTYQLGVADIEWRLLELTVWHQSSLNQNIFLGGVNIALVNLAAKDPDSSSKSAGLALPSKWYQLTDIPGWFVNNQAGVFS